MNPNSTKVIVPRIYTASRPIFSAMSIDLPFDNVLPEMKLAISAVTEAGKAVMNFYGKKYNMKSKDGSEFVTDADIKSNTIIQKILSVLDYPILSEESTDDKNRLSHDKIWVVDPLDGTSDFVKKTGEFTIMIALVKDLKPILGVILRPTSGELFVSQKGCGAYHLKDSNWSVMTVNSVSDLGKCKAVASRSHFSDSDKKVIERLVVAKLSFMGSSLKALDICLGRSEIYLTTTNKIKHWDTCASYSIVTEAGGRITDLLGNELFYNTDSVIHQNGLLITNSLIHNKVVEIAKL